MKRFMFEPFWKLTQWGFLPEYLFRINPGGDRWRHSKFVIVPLVGWFVWFDKNVCMDHLCEEHPTTLDDFRHNITQVLPMAVVVPTEIPRFGLRRIHIYSGFYVNDEGWVQPVGGWEMRERYDNG